MGAYRSFLAMMKAERKSVAITEARMAESVKRLEIMHIERIQTMVKIFVHTGKCWLAQTSLVTAIRGVRAAHAAQHMHTIS